VGTRIFINDTRERARNVIKYETISARELCDGMRRCDLGLGGDYSISNVEHEDSHATFDLDADNFHARWTLHHNDVVKIAFEHA